MLRQRGQCGSFGGIFRVQFHIVIGIGSRNVREPTNGLFGAQASLFAKKEKIILEHFYTIIKALASQNEKQVLFLLIPAFPEFAE